MDGTGGTYFFKDPSHRNVGCFKPQDEEPFGPNNPRGLIGQLGQDHFAGVPATSLVESRHPVFNYTDSAGALHFKMGSLQEFVRHDDVASDLAPNQFSNHQVHKIVLLDMRLLNTDRNDANILVRKRRSATTGRVDYELTPIDHGYCLPQFLEIAWCDWCWYNWPQLHEPLSAEDCAYVLSLSAQEETERLGKMIPLRRACRRNMIIAGMVVQKGVRGDLVPFEIARIMCREDLDAPSMLENLCLEAFRQLQVTKQRRQHDALFHHAHLQPVMPLTVPSNATTTGGDVDHQPKTTAPVSIPPSPRAAFRNLRVSIDPPSSRESFSFGRSPVASGAQSPPGFWASYAPFSSDEEEEEEDYSNVSSVNGVGRHSAVNGSEKPRLSLNWDDMASHALSDAVQRVENGYSGASAIPSSTGAVLSNGHKFPSERNDARSPTSSFIGGENDKDEFELLNDALDDDVQDEKLFLSIFGRLLDEKIEAARRRQQEQQKLKLQAECQTSASTGSSSSRSPIPSRALNGSATPSSCRTRD
ncbi:hypothetical protein BBJ28_00019048 [Nothophytophthora sp. Chile5]|nr:hypothetical protein BBJ28_00019048 [Nothophytophthora sp. Chile5]